MASCWFAALPGAGACDGHLVRCHLIPKQQIRNAATTARSKHGERWPHTVAARAELSRLLDDPRCWVPGCGGPTGIGGHHGMLDHSRTLRVPRDRLPEGLEAFADELGLDWWLEREYGPQAAAA